MKTILFATIAFFATVAHAQNGFNNPAQVFPDSLFKGSGSLPEQTIYAVTPGWSVTVPMEVMAFQPSCFGVKEPVLKWYDFSTYKFKGEGTRCGFVVLVFGMANVEVLRPKVTVLLCMSAAWLIWAAGFHLVYTLIF